MKAAMKVYTIPRFSTRIPQSGSAGNIMVMLGCARSLMKQLRVDSVEIEALSAEVMAAGSYAEACDLIRRWFPLEDDED